MKENGMGAVESRFADIIWEREPISSNELAKISEESFRWKKSTTYTVLRRLCDKGIFKNEKGTVTSCLSREDYYSLQTERFVEESFSGSLPMFLAAFTKRKALSDEEITELKRMLREFEEGK